MKNLKYIKRFNEHQENLNISDVSVQSKHSIGDRVKIKHNLDDIIGVSGMYLSKGPKHPLYKIQDDNDGMNDFLGKEAKIVYIVYSDDKSNDRNDFRFSRYLIDIDNGDYWWVDECFD
jgi:hypothetical protein